MTPPLYVAVCGPGHASDEETGWAEEIGRLLARSGAVVVCGGLAGVMEAAARGAKSEGGLSVGLLPGSDRSEAAKELTIALPTGIGETRNTLLVRAVDALIAVGGEFGTLSEIALALRMGVPVVGLSTWELHKHGERVSAFVEAATPQEAVEKALALAAERV